MNHITTYYKIGPGPGPGSWTCLPGSFRPGSWTCLPGSFRPGSWTCLPGSCRPGSCRPGSWALFLGYTAAQALDRSFKFRANLQPWAQAWALDPSGLDPGPVYLDPSGLDPGPVYLDPGPVYLDPSGLDPSGLDPGQILPRSWALDLFTWADPAVYIQLSDNQAVEGEEGVQGSRIPPIFRALLILIELYFVEFQILNN